MKTLATQLENRALGPPDDGLAQTLATLCAHMSHVVYTSRNTRFLATGYGKINYLFLLFFQRMAYCLAHFFPAGQTLAPQDASYLRQLSCLLAALETKLDPPHSQQLLRRLQFLQDTCALSSPAGTEAMAEALALLVDALEEMAHTPMDQAMTHWPLLSEERKTLDGLFQFHRFQSRFAIRLAVVLCLSFTFVYLTQWPFAYWYPMTVFLMLMPYAEESAARINNRVLGLLMTALLLSLFHSLPAYVFLVALMTCLMYYVPLTSTSMSTYGTCYGMILAILLVDIRLAIGLRLAYVAMAAVTAWTANRFLFPITEPGQVRDSLQTLLETDARMLAELQEMLSSNSSRHSFRQYLIRSNMLTQEMETLLAGSPSTAAHTLLLHLLPLQRKLSTELELLYIDDLVEGMFDLLEGKEQHCEFDGVETVLKADGRYCCVPVTHKVTLGEIVNLLQEFKAQPTTLMMPKMPDGSFAKKLYSLYLTYLPTDKFKYALKMNVDNRGSFTELVHTADCGQVSINISRPGITKGQHWHNSKWELFIVVAGHGLIQERNINTGETVEFEVSGDKIEAVHMIPDWTHNIINLSETENLVTVMTCNEIFNPNHPDTFFEPV